VLDLLPEAAREATARAMQRALETTQPVCYDGELVDDEHRAWYQLQVAPLLDAAGRPEYLAFHGTEVTGLRRLERRLGQAHKLDAIGRLAAGIAHDFNNVLMAITGYVELASRAVDEAHPASPLMLRLRRVTGRGASLANRLLALGRRPSIQPHPLDLNEVVSDAGDLLRRLLGEDIELHVEPASTRLVVESDPGELEQVIVNLAVNARDAMPDGGRLVIRTAEARPEECPECAAGPTLPAASVRRCALLSVEDSGTGMDEETLARVFEPFYTTKGRGKGTGLGLYVSHETVRRHGGVLELHSTPDGGTTARVLLPLADAEPRSISRPDGPTDAPTGTETVLVVEDEPLVRDLMGEVLIAHGYEVLLASDGEEALDLVSETLAPFDLLLADVRLPRVSGPEVARRLRERRPDLRVLFITGSLDDRKALGIGDEPGTGTIRKPVTPTRLAVEVRRLLDGA